MKWYDGGIAEAVAASKSKGAIFVVYIEGTDEQSQRITESMNNGALGRELENDNFVAIKIEAGSVSHQQFSEIFKDPSVPSVYFIGKSGKPVDIITGSDSLDIVDKRIGAILASEGKSNLNTGSSDVSANLIQNEQAAEGYNTVVCENGVCRIRRDEPSTSNMQESQDPQQESTPAATEDTVPQEPTHEEKVQKAKELLEKKRLEKEKEEKERERQQEIERRKIGQGVQQLKKWQEDQELKEMIEKREKEKRENQLARERVLAQIAQDKAERLSRNQANSPPVESPKASQPQQQPKPSSSTARLQFKLPDGSSTMQEFPNSDCLQSVINFVKAHMKLSAGDFRLSTVFPRREFTQNDYSQTLLDLQLFPNAVILVLPINRGTVATNPGGNFSSLIWNLFAPLLNIFGYLKNLVFGTGASGSGTKRPSDGDTETRADRAKRANKDPSVLRKQGNIHRLTDTRDSDDEGNTWNGNSTQQM